MTDDPRYARHTLVPGWDQARLAAAEVILIGLGALGNEVGRILAMSGVGSMILCDPDRVERSNLSRCALFRETDCGTLKVGAAARALADLAPGCRLDARPHTLIHGVGLAELRDAALVIGCLDSRAARLQLAGRCNLMRAPMIDGGTHPWGGELRPYLDPEGPCYGCGLGEDARARTDTPWSCVEATEATGAGAAEGATAAASVLIGGWMAMTALRHLLGLPVPPGLLQIDGPAGTARRVRQVRDPDCPLHCPAGPVRRLPLAHTDTLGQLLAQLPPGAVPLAWSPVMEAVECTRCDYRRTRWGIPSVPLPAGDADLPLAPTLQPVGWADEGGPTMPSLEPSGSVGPRPTAQPTADACPRCGALLRPRTTLELDRAPPDLTLAALGLAPREVLAVRTPDGWDWVELSPGSAPAPRLARRWAAADVPTDRAAAPHRAGRAARSPPAR